jgi:hypothetical protein
MLTVLAGIALAIGGADTPPVPLLGGSTPDRVAAAMRPSRSAYAGAIRRSAVIPQRLRPWASCVSERESGGSYSARNPASSAQGRWQLLDTAWRVNGGIEHIVARRLAAHGVPRPTVRAIRQHLDATPIYRWPAPYQDAAFVQIVQEGGARHWAGPGCGLPR